MNLNFSNQPEYDLNKSLIKEVIDTYGIKIKFLKTEKINIDNVLGDFSHMKTDKDKIFEMFALPENSECCCLYFFQWNQVWYTQKDICGE